MIYSAANFWLYEKNEKEKSLEISVFPVKIWHFCETKSLKNKNTGQSCIYPT
jgi:hypothetical protein